MIKITKEADNNIIGEFAIISKDEVKGADNSDFFEAMMAFQYGDMEESRQGFERMMEIATQPSILDKPKLIIRKLSKKETKRYFPK